MSVLIILVGSNTLGTRFALYALFFKTLIKPFFLFFGYQIFVAPVNLARPNELFSDTQCHHYSHGEAYDDCHQSEEVLGGLVRYAGLAHQ